MNCRKTARRATVGLALLGCGLTGPVASASASDVSIKRVISTYAPKVAVAEGHALRTIGEYATTRNAVPVEAALGNSIVVLRALKTKIEHQSAVRAIVKLGKAKLEKGLGAVIRAYEHLQKAFNEQAASPQAASEQALKARAAVKRGRRELAEGLSLLKK